MTATGPETFYPSCVVNLTLTFDNKLQVFLPEGGSGNVQQLVSTETASTYILNRVPKKCSVQLQGHTQAATFKLIFDYRELPIDPRTIITCTAEVHMGTVSSQDFSDGMQRQLPNGNRRSILKTRSEDNRTLVDNMLIVGPVDNWTAEYGADGAEIHLEGRDLRGILLDSPLVSSRDVWDELHRTRAGMPTRRRRRSTILSRLDSRLRIDALVTQILQEHDVLRSLPEADRVKVVTYPEEWPNQTVPSPGRGADLPRARRGASGQGAASGGSQNNLNFWDIITRYCFLVGAVPRFVGRTLEIRYAPSIYRMVNPDNRDTPFRPNERRSLGDDNWGIRRLVWGRDITSMKIARKYAGVNKPHAIRVIAADNSSGRRGRDQLLQVVWPPRNIREARREGVPGNPRDFVGGQESQDIRTYRVGAVRSIEQLTQIAQSFYEQIGRQEMSADVEAARITSFGGSNADPDLLRLRVGDPIELLVDASSLRTNSPITSTLNATSQATFAEASAAVARHLNGNISLARVIVATNRGNIMGSLRYFMVSSVNYDWSYEEVTVKADLQNYITYSNDETQRQALSNARRHGPTRSNRTHATAHPAASTPGPAQVSRPAVRISEDRVSTPASPADYTSSDPFDVEERGPSRWR